MRRGPWHIGDPVPSPRDSEREERERHAREVEKMRARRCVPQPVDFSQSEAREQRRLGWSYLTHYVDGFDVVAEVRERCGPLAAEVAGMAVWFKDSRAAEDLGMSLIEPGFRVVMVARATHHLRLKVTELLAQRGSAAVRNSLAAVVTAPAHGSAPVIDDEGLRSGSWVDGLAAHVEPLRDDLATLMTGRPAGAVDDLDLAVSDALRGFNGWDGLDQTARDLASRVEYLRRQVSAHQRAVRLRAEEAADLQRKRRESALSALGLS